MKRAVSISIGSSRRDKAVEISLLGQQVIIERIGTDGDMDKAAALFGKLDGQVDAFGVGGADLAVVVDGKVYPLYSVRPMVRTIRQTPVVDGAGLKNTIESGLAQFLDQHLPGGVRVRRVLITAGADRWGMTTSFTSAGYECLFGDLMFGLGLPIALHSAAATSAASIMFVPKLRPSKRGVEVIRWAAPARRKSSTSSAVVVLVTMTFPARNDGM